jgi:glycosyltransferase involved in cell wall biosynthesis
MEKMKVLHVSTGRVWRGGENQLSFLLKGLAGLGVENHVAVQPGTPLTANFAPYAAVRELRMGNDLDLPAAFRLASFCSKEGFAVLHAHTARAHSLALLAKKIITLRGNRPPALVVHRRSEQGGEFSFSDRLKYLSPGVDRFICISAVIAEQLRARGVPQDRLQVIHSAVDPAPHAAAAVQRAAARAEFGIAPDQTAVCCVGAVEKLKGSDVMLRAWLDLSRSGFNGKLLMIGEGALLGELKSFAAANGLAGSVIFTGFRNDVPRLMAACDALALPTLSEGLGTVLLDGLLAGCVPVASEVGGVGEVVLAGRTGLLVPPGDPAALAAALNRLAASPALRAEMVQAGRALAASDFSITDMVRRTFAVYGGLAPSR